MNDTPLPLSADRFAPALGSAFQLRSPGGQAVPVVLTRIVDRGGGLHTTQFSLLFQVPAGGPTEQNVYTLDHEHVGSIDLLLVPVAQIDDGLLFEAAIALLRAQTTERGEN